MSLKTLFGVTSVFLFASTALSLAGQTAQVTIGTQTVQSDGTVVIPIQLSSGGQQVVAIQFDVTFDSTVSTIAPSVGSSASSAAKNVNDADVVPTLLRVVLAGVNQNSIPDGTLTTLLITPVSAGFSGTVYLSNAIGSDPSGTGLTVSSPGLPPPPVTLSIVNGASQLIGAIAPGEIVSLYQAGMLPQGVAASDVSVTFNGTPAPLLYAGPNQINAITPFALAGKTSAAVAVNYQGSSVAKTTVSVAPTAPAIFTANGSGKGQAAILNQDGTLNSPSNPAPVGTIVSLFATGAGVFNPPLTDGQIVPTGSTAAPVARIGMGLGNYDTTIKYIGPAPGMVAGVLQVNFLVPSYITPGTTVAVNIGAGGVVSPFLTMAVY